MKPIRILTTLLAIALCGAVNAEPIPETYRQNGWFVGAQAYTFRKFTTFEAIAKTKEAGGKIVEIYPGQTLKPGSDVKVHHSMPEEAIVELLAECERQGLRCVNYGVVNAKDADEVKAIMAFAKRLGLYAVSTESAELVAAWEAAAIENDVKVAFHQHGGKMSNPKYKVWHPLYIRGLVEGRDERLGASADLGHWRTSHLDSVECLRILEGRIISVHLKDKEKDGNAPVVTVGTGVVDVAACLEELKRQNFDGHLSVEHENHWDDNVSHVKAAIDFVKANPK